MKRYGYRLLIALAVLTGCHGIDPLPDPGTDQKGEKVEISFQVAVPNDGADTRAMGNTPTIDPDGFYIAVFGGSGYFNEWVKATVVSATANYDPDNTSGPNGSNATIYSLTAEFSISDSRLRLHFIANCPTAVRTSPPISGGQDTEEYVMSRIRSQLTDTYNDSYWQKVILPNGVRVNKVGNEYVATDATMAQFPTPIILVRNFARVYLRNLTEFFTYTDDPSKNHQLVTISKFGLAYAPSEGVVAPILSAPFSTDASGNPIAEPAENDTITPVYFENFLMNYQRYPLIQVNDTDTLLTAAPFNYGGYSPSNQAYNYYPNNDNVGIPTDVDLQEWDNEHPENNVLFVYERTMPSASRRATRLIIKAVRQDYEGDPEPEKFYALDIVNTEGVAIPLLRNQSYTVHLLNIEAGTGESDINKASTATSASVTGDPNYQNLINISDGKSSIGTSFTEKFYVKPQRDTLMFRYIPTNVTDSLYTANQEGNDRVIIKIGSLDEHSGIFTELTAVQASAQGILAFDTAQNAQNEDSCKVWIVKDNSGKAISFVRNQNSWVEATAAQIANTEIEKWGMIVYDLNTSYKDADNYFTEERTQAIHVEGTYNGNTLSRNVVIKTSPRQTMSVTCMQKYVLQNPGEQEVVRILIPRNLSRSVFPLEFTIEPDGYSLTPDGDVLPVAFGSSTIPSVETPAFYFIRTVTQTEYNDLDSIPVNGTYWKCIDCNFKTTVSKSACTVYVHNKYFNDATSNDDFFNFKQRLFTFPNSRWSSTSVTHGDHVTFTFRMDYANNGNELLWWDPANVNSLDSTKRVLPHAFTVILDGFAPQYQSDNVTPVTAELEHKSGNTYTYNVPDYFTEIHNYANVIQLELTANTVGTGRITLSTTNITENPYLYKVDSTSTLTIAGAQFLSVAYSGSNYTDQRIAVGVGKSVNFSFKYADNKAKSITVSFEGLEPDGFTGTNAQLSANDDGTYTFTPSGDNVGPYTLALKTTTRFSPCTVTLVGIGYNISTTTATRSPLTFTTTSAYYSSSNKSRTEEGVTVAFSNTNPTFGSDFTTAPTNTDITVTAPSGCHITSVVINYQNTTYYANSVTVRSGGGSYNRNNAVGTWTAGNNTTTSVVLRTTKRPTRDTRIVSIVVTIADD